MCNNVAKIQVNIVDATMLQYIYVMRKVSMTKSLVAVLNKFDESNDALSVVRLVDELSHEMNRTTVYRILKRLEENEKLHSFIGPGGLKWYAKTNDQIEGALQAVHPHFHCEDCGKIQCLPIDLPVPSLPNHQIRSVSYLIVGSCGRCDD